jgi:uncharacterized protein with NAD-binding domain and iron-sulfur cluster
MRGQKEVIVVGGGLAGLSCAMRLCENGCSVKIISVTLRLSALTRSVHRGGLMLLST